MNTFKFNSNETIGSKLDASRGVGQGFDFLRIFLASMVVYMHAWSVLGLKPEKLQPTWFMTYWVLAIFFSLSGFLITGSALRLRLKDFIINRSLRIVPALAVDIFFAALIMGPLITAYSINIYVSQPEFFTYFLNITGYIHYDLPGVFLDHPSSKVNISLWTVPFEILCYVLISMLVLSRTLHMASVSIASAISFMVGGVAVKLLKIPSDGNLAEQLIFELFCGRGSKLLVCFLLGISIFQLRHKIPYDRRLFLACLTLCAVFAIFVKPDSPLARVVALNWIASFPLVYIMAFLGVTKLPKLPLFHRGDYSYGIYLYGFPIQQIVYGLTKSVVSPTTQFLMSMPFIIGFAMLSWHLVEEPILRMRKKFSFIAKQRLADAGAETTMSSEPATPQSSRA